MTVHVHDLYVLYTEQEILGKLCSPRSSLSQAVLAVVAAPLLERARSPPSQPRSVASKLAAAVAYFPRSIQNILRTCTWTCNVAGAVYFINQDAC